MYACGGPGPGEGRRGRGGMEAWRRFRELWAVEGEASGSELSPGAPLKGGQLEPQTSQNAATT